MSKRKPCIEYYWSREVSGHTHDKGHPEPVTEWRVNWRLKGANGEIMCQSTQGFRDKADAERSVLQVAHAFYNLGSYVPLDRGVLDYFKHAGPGRKPS